MGNHNIKRDSWESLSSAFSNLEISISQDSCYASDEVSVISTIPASAIIATVPSFGSAAGPLRPLKSILKKPCTDMEEDSESESGYGSEASDYESEIAILDDDDIMSDEEDDSFHSDSVWDEDAPDMPETHDVDDDFFDDSFVTFESMVRFDSNVRYIEAPESHQEEDSANEMTLHEMMELARASDSLLVPEGEDSDNNHSCVGSHVMAGLQEHPRDEIDLDKQLFIAYMNGINGITDCKYKSRLRARVDDMRGGRTESPFSESDSPTGMYLDHVLEHVIGVFRKLVAKEEFEELVSLKDEKQALEQRGQCSPAVIETCTKTLLDKIERLLSERLARGTVEIRPDELSLFAGGIVHALEHPNLYTYNL